MHRLACAALLVLLSVTAGAAPRFEPEIAYHKHILPNGLTLIVHEDHKTPIVAVNVWYHVGSKDERPGRTGFAHLFEHLMFNGSEHHDDEFFRPLEAVGASKMNGTTWYDRTNYFQNVPPSALDLALWLESDRMGHLLGAVDQAKLDEQREVVLNEKRQNENQPYGRVGEVIARATYPEGHPYSWTSIGSEADLKAATLDDVRAWFGEHYGAANAVLVVAGDVNADEVRKKVELYFGDIPAGPPRTRHTAWVARMQGTKRTRMQDRVPQARLFKVWNVPGACERDTALLDLAADVLAGGKTSRLYRRLVYDARLATSVSAGTGPFEIGSQFTIDAMVAPGADAAAVERAIDEELARFLAQGPTAEELSRVRAGLKAGFVRGLERVDGFGGKSALLAQYQVYCGSPDAFAREYRWIETARVQDVRDAARAWLSDGQFVLHVDPYPEHRVSAVGADRSRPPPVGEPPALQWPPVERTRLGNGVEVWLARRGDVPLVHLALLFDAGYAADAHEAPGTARMTLDMLDEGAAGMSAIELAQRRERLAVQIGAHSNLDSAFVLLNSLREHLPEALQLLADVVQRPAFPEHELARLKSLRLAAIAQEKSQPQSLVGRLYPALLYGAQHPYAAVRSGSGTEASVRALTVADLRRFHRRWIRPDRLRIVVVGDTRMDELRPVLERSFGSWQPPDEPAPQKDLPEVALPAQPRVFLVHKPEAPQTLILGAHLAPPKSDPDDAAFHVVTQTLGGLFVSRLNLNLREARRWSYGASSVLGSARAQRPWVVYAPVQADRSADSLREILRELHDLTGARPITAEELKLSVDNTVVGLPGDHETNGQVAASWLNILQYGLRETYYDELAPRLRALSVERVNAAARKLVRPEAMTWVIVGDLARIEAPIRALNLGPVQVLDADGAVLR